MLAVGGFVGQLVPSATAAPPKTAAETPVDPVKTRRRGADLRRCIELAQLHHPDLAMAQARLAAVRAQLTEAHTAPFMQFRMTGGVGLAPTLRGGSVFSPNTDAALTSNLGVAWRINVSGVVPLWTFGKISNLWDAAEANIRVHQGQVRVTQATIRFDVRRAYWGLQLARDGLALLGDAQSQLAEAAIKLEEAVENDDADPIDLFKLQAFAAALPARRAEAEKFAVVALAGLRFYTGVPNLAVRIEPLEQLPHKVKSLTRYLGAARVYRPEILMARAGVSARQAQVRLARSQLYPDVGLALSAGLTTAPEVANQLNPFVNDPANLFSYGAAVVFQWNLDILPRIARIQQAEAKLWEMEALDRKALGGVAQEVEAAYAGVLEWEKRHAAYAKAEKIGKRWLVTVKQAIDIGTMDEKDLVDPAKTYAEYRYNRLDAAMQYNLALAKLAQVTGWDAIVNSRRRTKKPAKAP